MGTWIKIAAMVVVAAAAAGLFVAWGGAQREHAALQAELKTTRQALADATARQASRDATVNDLVAGLKKKEASVQKPAQVGAGLPDVLTLPVPITIEPGTVPTQKQPGAPDGPPDMIQPK